MAATGAAAADSPDAAGSPVSAAAAEGGRPAEDGDEDEEGVAVVVLSAAEGALSAQLSPGVQSPM